VTGLECAAPVAGDADGWALVLIGRLLFGGVGAAGDGLALVAAERIVTRYRALFIMVNLR